MDLTGPKLREGGQEGMLPLPTGIGTATSKAWALPSPKMASVSLMRSPHEAHPYAF